MSKIRKNIRLKGTRLKNMPRASKHRCSKGGSKRGISDHQVCIASAIDRYDNCFLVIVVTGQITSSEVEAVFKDKVEKVSKFITDCKSSYKKFAKDNHIKLEQSRTYTNANGYSLGNINSLHSEWSTFLSIFKGVSTKHLQHYLDWFSFQKLINYIVEILKQPMTIMKNTTIRYSNIKYCNVYDNSSGIDFSLVCDDYNFHPL